MAYTAIDDPTVYFDNKLYAGNGGTTNVTGLSFEPDMTWIKNRSAAGDHEIYDKVRGVGYRIYPNAVAAQDDLGSQGLSAWNSDGFTVGNNGAINGNGNNIVSWNWKANGAGATNQNGSINTIKTSASTASGVSISTYTGTGSNATVGHGLGVAPKVVIIKSTTAGEDWTMFHEAIGATKYLVLNSPGGVGGPSAGPFNNTVPTSSVFSVGTWGSTNGSSQTLVAYCFAEKQGFSKFGSYLGNGSTNGSFIYTGFSPALVIMKCSSSGATPWLIWDNKRPGYNVTNLRLRPNTNDDEDTSTADPIDLLSNGFKCRGSNDDSNKAGSSFIYMAFAESPFVSSTGIPTTAR